MRRRSMPNLLGDYVEIERRTEILERIMQVIGFSPEFPFTLTVNDGTWNRVYIGKINGDYGIKIVDNAGNEILLANGTIVADAIKTGTLDCDLITVANLSAGDISTGTLSADFISGGTLNCSLMTVSNLNAGSITVGTFVNINSRLTAQSIHGDKLQVGTIQADRIVADSITAGQIGSHVISGDEIAFGTLTGDHINARTIQADRIQTNSLTTSEINYMSGDRLTNYSVYGSRIVNSVSLGGLVQGTNFYTPGGIAIGISASASGILLQAGKNINWAGGEGSIYDVDIIEGYNDIRLYGQGTNNIQFRNTSGGGNLSMYPYWGDFYATGTKYFRIKHPDDPENKWIQYVSVESPEVALKIRGVAKLINGEVAIIPPHHWELVTEELLTTVQVTPLEDCNGLFVPKADLKYNEFRVKELNGGVSNAEFMWELTATRKDYSDFSPEQTVEAEVDKHVDALVEQEKENKTDWKQRLGNQKTERDEFRQKIHTRYKQRTGKNYVDKLKNWKEEELGIEEAKTKATELLKEKARLMKLAGEINEES